MPTTEPRPTARRTTRGTRRARTGGSSGGSAAAVASGMVPVAPRQRRRRLDPHPGELCGLFGLKPSRGRMSLGPDVGESWAGS